MATTLAEWDEQVAPYLHIIEDRARKISQEAIQIRAALIKLKTRPNWNTKAEDELFRASEHLIALREKVADLLDELYKLSNDFLNKSCESIEK